MKTYFIVKAYSFNSNTRKERFNYFGKNEKLLGYILEQPYGVKKYSANEIRKYGFTSFRSAEHLLDKLRSTREPFDGWTTTFTIIAETSST